MFVCVCVLLSLGAKADEPSGAETLESHLHPSIIDLQLLTNRSDSENGSKQKTKIFSHQRLVSFFQLDLFSVIYLFFLHVSVLVKH